MQDIYQTFEFDKIQNQISEYAKTELAKQYIFELKMLPDFHSVNEALEDLKEMMSLITRFGVMPIATSASALYLISLAKKTGLLTPRDLNLIADDVLTSQNITKFLNKIDVSYPRIKSYSEQFFDLSSLEKEIHRVINSSLAVNDNATPELKEIRTKLKKLEASLQTKVASLAYAYSKYLNDDNATIRDGHFVLPVKTVDKSKVLGVIYDVSDSGATTFIEPLEIVQINNDITALKVRENDEIRKILKSLTALVLLQEKEIIKNNQIIAQFDFLIAKSLYAQNVNAEVATLSKDKIIDLYKARHPLIDQRKVVSNSYHLNEEKRMIIISGPNAGGKTVSLKTVGLLTLMNQCGLPITVEKATLSYFDHIYIDIGDNQSLSDNLSTFSAHMSNLGEISQIVKGKDLILIDELGTGTDPKEGEALAISLVKHFENKHCLCIISSHFSSLKEYALISSNIENSSMVFDEDNLLPTYIFRQGIPGQSYALDVASRYGLSQDIIDQAKQYLSNKNQDDVSTLLNVLQKKMDQSARLEEQLHKKEKELDKLAKDIASQASMLKDKKQSLLQDVNEEKRQIIEDTQKQIKELMQQLSNGDVKLHDVIRVKKELDDLLTSPDTIIYDENINEGDMVEIPSLNMRGRVSSIKGDKALVNSDDGFSFSISKDKLHKIVTNTQAPKVRKNTTSNIDVMFTNQKKIGLELNLIGMHVEEAQNALIQYLDSARLRRFKTVRIIHGFGSGALRKMVRTYLDTQKDLSYRSGDNYEGGGGATVVNFK